MSLKTQGIPHTIMGDTVIGYTSGRQIKDLGWSDLSTLSSWYKEDPNKNHLGLINLFEKMGTRPMPMYKNFFKEKAVLETNGVNSGFTYDVPVTKSNKGVYTTEDTSGYVSNPGIDGSLFPLKLDKPFRNGDVLTYDAFYGAQAIVSEDRPISREGDSWVHWCTLVDNDANAWFPSDKLQAGIEYFKIGHALGEYSTQFSGLSNPDTVDTLKCEFVLGNHRGVESYYTMYADKKSFSGASATSRQYLDKWLSEAEQIGTDADGKPLDMFFVGKLASQGGKKGLNMRTMRIGSVLERLVLAELARIESYQLFFQKGALIPDINGTKRLNEGLVHQLRRGRIVSYSKPGTFGKNQLKQIGAYVYKYRPDIPLNERVLKIKCGRMLYDNINAVIQKEAVNQLSGLSAFSGFERVLPKSPVTGSNLTDLEVSPVAFKKVMIPGVGYIIAEHEPTFDFQPLTDRGSRGFYGEEGLPLSSYSGMIDAMDASSYGDVSKMVTGASVVENGNLKANIYYVKPEGDGFYMGYSEGRWSPNKASDIASSLKTMAREVWAHSISASWVKDPSRYVFVEIKRFN